ncbi:MAG TPA: GAF domain-containing protein, partial [Thermoanaerobaculales bacterium]|nr:GAF domain-containing protein [Thermoanaerobaculales bacterium]
MIEPLPGWTPHCERMLKEVLYRFLEEVHCTRAGLYLRTQGGDLQLAVRYGFGRAEVPPARLAAADPLAVAAAGLTGLPLVVNRVEEVPALEERLRSSGIQRMMLVPLVERGWLVGLVDAREKGGQRPFDEPDRQRA